MFDDSDHWRAFLESWKISGFVKMQEFAWLSDKFSWLSDKCAWLSDKFSWLSDKFAWLSDKFSWLSDKFSWLSDKFSWLSDNFAWLSHKLIICEQTLFYGQLDSWLVGWLCDLLVSKWVSWLVSYWSVISQSVSQWLVISLSIANTNLCIHC